MAGLDRTMSSARQRMPAVVPAPVAVPTPAPAPAPAAAQEPETFAERLGRLDSVQLAQVVASIRGRWALSGDRDDEALRRSLTDFVEEWGDDAVAESMDDEPEQARAEGREYAVIAIDEEIDRIVLGEDAPTKQASDA
jgi:hypothetical protein